MDDPATSLDRAVEVAIRRREDDDALLPAVSISTDLATGRCLSCHTFGDLSGLASSTDEFPIGLVQLWDARALGRPALRLSAHTDFVADFQYVEDKGRLLSVSGDGTLAVFDPRAAASGSGSGSARKRKGGGAGVEARSEDDGGDELLSVAVLKGGQKVVCGSQSGVLHIFSWGYWNDCSDRFPGHPESVDAVVRWDDGTLLTGSSDGVVRAVSVLPNRFVGVVGEHMDCPIERMALSGDERLLATVSHDNQLKFWDLWESDKDEEEVEFKSCCCQLKLPDAFPALCVGGLFDMLRFSLVLSL